MNRKSFLRTTLLVVLYLAIYAGLGIFLVNSREWFELYKSLVPIALAVPAAILTQAVQRRISYLQALRELWKQLIPAIQTAIQYTHLPKGEQNDFSKVMIELSTAIDATRGVFANVPVNGVPSGLYPYENLKDIQNIITWIKYGDNFKKEEDRDIARKCITRLWQEMYGAMLREFDRDVPLEPVSKYFYNGKSIADYLVEGTLTNENLKKHFKPSEGIILDQAKVVNAQLGNEKNDV